MKKLDEYFDIELAEIAGKLYQQLMMIQADIQAVSQEIQKRKSKVEEKK